jgi:DNA-binding response OmpR family regulator
MENNSATILVVDEEALNRDMLSRRLKRHGYQVLEAVDGYAALGMLEIETVNVVLLDIMMPGISGLEVLRKIRETRTESQLPVIMASALNDNETIVKSLNQGAND